MQLSASVSKMPVHFEALKTEKNTQKSTASSDEGGGTLPVGIASDEDTLKGLVSGTRRGQILGFVENNRNQRRMRRTLVKS